MDSKSLSVEVEVISKETIKPSVPTPDHLKTFKISLLDQISPPLYVPIILFYTGDHHKLDENLKKSLSEALTHFYPLAGRTRDNILIDCNDDGVDYIEARVKGNISEFMKRPEVLHQLLPYDVSSSYCGNDMIQVGVQVNKFECGGIAIGMCISHKIADASSMISFINSWASIARTGVTESPTFDSVHLYPPCEGIPSENSFTTPVEEERVVTKRFVLDASKIANLRAKLGDLGNGSYPSRVQAVAGLIWKCIMAKPSGSSSSSKLSILNLPVNLRGRMEPPLDQRSFGNLLTLATTASTGETGSLEQLVGQIKVALSNINGQTIKYIQGEGGLIKFQELLRSVHEMFAKGEVYMFSSWCRFPIYEADFGWGKPTWVSLSSARPYKNIVILMDTRTGDGIEAWVSLVEEDMTQFQQNQELLEFVSFTD